MEPLFFLFKIIKAMKNIQALVLAAGKGTRLNAKSKPKVLFTILGKPIIDYIIKSLNEAGFEKPVVVVGFKGKLVQDYLKNKATCVWQKRQLGTGHAVMQAKKALQDTDAVLIIYGDMPFWHPETFKRLIKSHQKTGATLSMATAILDKPSFFQYGRILRDKKGNVLGIIEEKEASEKEKKIKESNPGCYLVKTDWLWQTLSKIKKSHSGEYYLTDILGLAVAQGQKINTLPIKDWKQVVGINTKEHLSLAEEIIKGKKSNYTCK